MTLAKERDLNLGWLDELPNAHKLCAAICLKGLSCSAAATRHLSKVQVHSCVEEPGGHENGHEGVCAFRFLVDNYEEPTWQHLFFLHGDVNTPHHAGQYKAFVKYLERDEWPKWPSRRADIQERHCGCGYIGVHLNAFGPRDFWFTGLTWWYGAMIEPRDASLRRHANKWATSADCHTRRGTCTRAGVGAWPLHNGTLSSPLGFMFAVDRASALQRSKRFLQAQYRMCKVGVRVMPPGREGGAARAARLTNPGFDYNPLVWGHVNERLPYFVFGHEFVEKPVPDCVWEGDHANMNCTQPTVRMHGHGHAGNRSSGTSTIEQLRERERERTSLAEQLKSRLKPSVSWGCKPFDKECGTTG